MSYVYWGEAQVRSEWPGLYIVTKIRPRWYWWLRRFWVTWRLWRADRTDEYPVGLLVMWDVAGGISKGQEPCEVHKNRNGVRTAYERKAD